MTRILARDMKQWNNVKSTPETKVSHKGSRQQRQHTSLDCGFLDRHRVCCRVSAWFPYCHVMQTKDQNRHDGPWNEETHNAHRARKNSSSVLYTAWRFENVYVHIFRGSPQAASTGVPCALLTSTTDLLSCALQSSKYDTYKSTQWAMCILPQFNKNQDAIYWMWYIYWIIIQHLTY